VKKGGKICADFACKRSVMSLIHEMCIRSPLIHYRILEGL